MHPLIADGGEMTVLRDLAAYSYGQWSVDWPESVPDDQRPELPDDRDFGYASKPDRHPGVFARRFVRADVDITAQDFDDAGAPIPFTGESNVEETLDETSRRTEGDVFFEREITRAGLGALVPRVDFDVDSIVPVLIWGKTIMSPVTSIEDIVELGTVVDSRVYVGGQLLLDDEARERANREIERTIAQERRERVESVAKERKARKADVESVRGVLTGEGEGQEDLLASLAGLNKQLQKTQASPQPGLIPAYIALNTRLWEVQQEVNAKNEEFQRLTAELDAQQSEQIEQMQEVQKQQALESQGRIRELMATPGGTSDPNVPVERKDNGVWMFTIRDAVRGSMMHATWYKGTFGEGEQITVNWEDIRVVDSPGVSFSIRESTPYVHLRWAAAEKKQVTIDRFSGAANAPRSTWSTILTVDAPAKPAHQVALRLKVTWGAATYDDTYGIRIRAGDRVLQERMMEHLGPVAFWGNGQRWMSVLVSGEEIDAGEDITVEVYSTASLENSRRVKEAELTGTWIEEV
ncbi:MAG: hypothetical protein E6Y04_08210 [Corynebacterium sp.]|uniref:hypothetical protein n=1 Tax=Corynebacterium sp. TaxID=1720 RepID=UPI00290F76AD|nr:hypothetical protein [Corynebacterium sp.]MDU4729938.1 hypothetical protein [Corynebacterium sp.]